MTLKELLDSAGVDVPQHLAELPVMGIERDSRKLEPGFLFVAIRGFAGDGHDFVCDALASGAVAAITEKPVSCKNFSRVIVNSDADNRKLLSKISAVFYENPWEKLKTVGITGTNGKTSTAHILAWILEKVGLQTGVMGTVGHVVGGRPIAASITTPDSLDVARYMRQMVKSGDSACVMEVSSHALVLERVSNVRFDVSLFTNISQDHLDFHSTMGEYLDAKKKIFSLMKPSGVPVIGTYSPVWPNVSGSVTFGERVEDDYSISDIEIDLSGSRFTLRAPQGEYRVVLKIPGRFNIYNAVGAIAAASQTGVSTDKAVEAVGSFPGVPGRMERIDCTQQFLVAVDYAHTPDALERVLRQGAQLARNRLIAVFGCGGDRDRKKRPIMGRIAVEHADIAIVTSDNPRTEDPAFIINEILAGVPAEYQPVVEPDRASAIRKAIQMADDGDVVIIAGKGHEDYQILGTEKIHFDDREQAREALADRGYPCGH